MLSVSSALKSIFQPAMAGDDKWITVKPNGPDAVGRPALIGEGGEIKAGMGGKFTGEKINEISRTFENERWSKGEYPSQKQTPSAASKPAPGTPEFAKAERQRMRVGIEKDMADVQARLDAATAKGSKSDMRREKKNMAILEAQKNNLERMERQASGVPDVPAQNVKKGNIPVSVVRETPKAVLVKNEQGEEVWVQKRSFKDGQVSVVQFEKSKSQGAERQKERQEATQFRNSAHTLGAKPARETDKAVGYEVEVNPGASSLPSQKKMIWIPKSQVDSSGKVPGWLIEKKLAEATEGGGFIEDYMGFEAIDSTPRERFALDTFSKRRIDDNGFMHVSLCHISKESVNPYYGREIPKWKELGLDAEKIYQGYRSGPELAKGVATFNGLPLLFGHHPESAENPQKEHRIGSTGTEAAFDAPYLNNALSITDAEAIEAIERGERIELSSCYRYDPVFEQGEFEGKPYDFIMTNIRGNHVALVEEGRAGSDVAVADEQIKPKPIARIKMGVKELIEKLKAFLHSAENAGAELDPDSLEKGKELISDMNAVFGEKPAEDDELDGLGAELYALIDTIEDRELADKIKAKIEEARMSGGQDEDPEKAIDEEETALEKEEQVVGQAFEAGKESEKKEEGITAMDAALIQNRATMNARNHLRALTDAARKVRGLCGEVDPFAFDSAGEIYRHALKSCGMRVKTRDVAALGDMVQMAMDAKNSEFKPVHSASRMEFSGPFAGLKNIKVEQ